MKWSFKIGRLWGIDVYLHSTFLALLAYVGLQDGVRGGNLAAGLGGVISLVALFLCVLLHEYGHALAARHYGIPTRDINLLPIGGVARLERIPDNPKIELVIAIAGPLVNVVIATVLVLGLRLSGHSLLPDYNSGVVAFAQRLLAVNVTLVLFNLLPAFPMDGGRVLRALLSIVLGPIKATKIAAMIGKGMAVVFAGVAIYWGAYMLLVIALFIWMGAGGEARAAEARAIMGRVTVARAMRSQFQTLAPADPLAHAAQLFAAGSQTDFPVVAGGRTVGVLSRSDLSVALASHGEQAPVERVMRTDFVTLQADEPLEPALARLGATSSSLAPVVWQGRLVGILTREAVREFLSIQPLSAPGPARPPVIVTAPPPLR